MPSDETPSRGADDTCEPLLEDASEPVGESGSQVGSGTGEETPEGLVTTSTRTRVMTWLVAVFAVLGVALLLVQIVGRNPAVRQQLDPTSAGSPAGVWAPAGGPESLRWTSDGRFLVMQTYGQDGTGRVVVWDSADETTRAADGMALVAVESAAPVVWLVPQAPTAAGGCGGSCTAASATGTEDSPPDELLAWDLAEPDSQPTADVPAKWHAEAGGGDWIAYYEIDPLEGCNPSRVLFNNKASSGEGHKAALPDDLVTFVPRGWSPSGRFLAIEELTQAADASQTAAASGDPASPPRRLIILDATNGQIVASTEVGPEAGLGAAWDPAKDVLLWSVSDTASESGAGVRLAAMAPGGGPQGASDLLGIEDPEQWKGAWGARIAGAGAYGAMVMVDYGDRIDAWRLGQEVRMVASAPWHEGSAYDASRGLAVVVVEQDYDRAVEVPVVLIYPPDGGEPTVMWRGVPRQPPGG